MKTKHYTNLVKALKDADVNFRHSTSSGQPIIDIYDEQAQDEITLYFHVDEDGNEKFICQE